MAAATTSIPPRAFEPTLYVVWALFWALMIVVAVQDTLSNPHISWWEPVLWEGSSCLFATLWFLAQRLSNDRYAAYLDRPFVWIVHHIKWLPLVSASFLIGIYAVRHGVYALVGREYRHESWSFVIAYETVKIVLFSGLWLGIIFGFNSYERWLGERQRLLAVQKSLAEAQLAQLRSQLRPHLFFNVLNTISALMHVDVERADRLLSRLGDLLRASLLADDRDLTPLREELRVLRLYADVMHERFADRVSIEWHVQEGVEDASVPALILQPLLENAFKHGVETSREHVRIDVAAQRHGERLLLCVRNSGAVLGDTVERGIGVSNCEERLRVLYDNEASLRLTQQGVFVEARIDMPWGNSATTRGQR